MIQLQICMHTISSLRGLLQLVKAAILSADIYRNQFNPSQAEGGGAAHSDGLNMFFSRRQGEEMGEAGPRMPCSSCSACASLDSTVVPAGTIAGGPGRFSATQPNYQKSISRVLELSLCGTWTAPLCLLGLHGLASSLHVRHQKLKSSPLKGRQHWH